MTTETKRDSLQRPKGRGFSHASIINDDIMPDIETHCCEMCHKVTLQDNVIEIRLRNPNHLLLGIKKSYWLCSRDCVKLFLLKTEETDYGIMVKQVNK